MREIAASMPVVRETSRHPLSTALVADDSKGFWIARFAYWHERKTGQNSELVQEVGQTGWPFFS
jgi:hypothetical protein